MNNTNSTKTKKEESQDNSKKADLTEGSPDSTNPVHSFLVEENRRLKERIEVLEGGLKKAIEFVAILPALRLANKDGFDECVDICKVLDLKGDLNEVLNQK